LIVWDFGVQGELVVGLGDVTRFYNAARYDAWAQRCGVLPWTEGHITK
jgi:hypothetical protein